MSQQSFHIGEQLLVETSVAPIDANHVRRVLERRYANGWIVLHEVANHLGAMATIRDQVDADRLRVHDVEAKRYLDTVAVGMYRATDYEILGHEIKVTRADWLAELRQPRKAQAFAHLVSRFYVVAPPDVVRLDELPPGWGLLRFHPSRLTLARQAEYHEVAIPRSWIASLLARAVKPVCVQRAD